MEPSKRVGCNVWKKHLLQYLILMMVWSMCFCFLFGEKFGIQKDMASWNTQDQGTIVASDVTKMQKQHPWEELIGAKKMARTVPHLKLVALTISTSRFCMMLGCSLGCPNPDSDVPTLFEKKNNTRQTRHVKYQVCWMDSIQLQKFSPRNSMAQVEIHPEGCNLWKGHVFSLNPSQKISTTCQEWYMYIQSWTSNQISITWNLFVLYFWASTFQNKAFSNKSKGHLGSRYR